MCQELEYVRTWLWLSTWCHVEWICHGIYSDSDSDVLKEPGRGWVACVITERTCSLVCV